MYMYMIHQIQCGGTVGLLPVHCHRDKSLLYAQALDPLIPVMVNYISLFKETCYNENVPLNKPVLLLQHLIQMMLPQRILPHEEDEMSKAF